jgi:hypothetical protein
VKGVRLIIPFVFWCGLPGLVFGWGSEGHRAIGALAAQLISAHTRMKVQQLLDEGEAKDLASVSTWADDVVEAGHGKGPLRNDPEALNFNHQFPDNWKWHFTNLPLGTRSYSEANQFATTNDVVHTIERCLRVLESRTPIANEFGRAQALRLLVHFVGDLHQPLHCGTGFYRLHGPEPPTLVIDPKAAFGLPNDRGGNDLFYGPKTQLHALWDVGLVEKIANSGDYHVLTGYLAKNYLAEPSAIPLGDYHHWPEMWVIESIKAANSAYAGIQFGAAEWTLAQGPLRIAITLPAGYEETNKRVAARQLTEAAVHLSRLLDQIKW